MSIKAKLVKRRLRSAGRVALTFDDGPDPVSTPPLLETLGDLGVHATFFVLGEAVEQHPELTRQIVEDGHELASHGFLHRDHGGLTGGEIRADMRRAQRQLIDLTGSAVRWYRPPYGTRRFPTYLAARMLGQQVTLWSVDPLDWEPRLAAATVAQRVLAAVGGGSIILLHDSSRYFRHAVETPPALEAVPAIVEGVRQRGLEIGSIVEGERG